MRYTLLPDRRTGEGCGFESAVRIEATSVGVSEPFLLSCRSTLALARAAVHMKGGHGARCSFKACR